MTTGTIDTLRRLPRLTRYAIYALAGILFLTIAETIAGTSDLTSRGTTGAALRLAIPILLAGLGGLYAERSGVVNIGLEGMMIAGTWFSAWASWQFGPWQGLVLGVAGGAAFGVLHALATVTFNVDHIVSGVAINILGLGSMRFLSSIVYTPDTGGSVIQSPPVAGIGNVSLPVLAGGSFFGADTPDLLGSIEDQGWFFVSDLAGVLRGLTGEINWVSLLALALVPITAWLLWKTAWGLRLRSCGEDPWAAESLGITVRSMKYMALVISGALAGAGGAFLVLVQAGIYREGMTGGRGFIGLGAMIFGNWLPAGVLSGSFVFGFGDSLRFRSGDTVRAFFLAVAIGLVLAGVYMVTQGRWRRAVAVGVAGVVFGLFYVLVTQPPNQLLSATPYLITLLVLAFASQRLRMPAADGARYMKGEAR
ncbi:MAG: ABC transporter permease [Actinobacteria bacterium]|nr:ABC transporter permease [Actinomycetota bacterium]MCI0677920.1 ABC transporter permease [Actinomycetota bacterium]